MKDKSSCVLMFEILELIAASNVYRAEALSALDGAQALLPELDLDVKPTGFSGCGPRVYLGRGESTESM
jgi:hypothetical protein